MPLEILETIANINYNTPRPRPIDAAVFFDLVKVRRLVDDATNLAVRAASDIASPTLTSVNGGLPGGSLMNTFGMGGPGHGAKLSRERKFRMREQASQKLSRAYRLDEIACSVATMQGASPLEEVGCLVLQRVPSDPDAKYVHFFHEKIPSRQLAESTSLQPLSDIISDRPGEPAVLRTRATVKVFKEDYEGAAFDLTHALAIARFIQSTHTSSQEQFKLQLQLQEPQRIKKRPHDVILAEKDQPSSLVGQLLFQRASVYLTMACQHVGNGIPIAASPDECPSSNSQAASEGVNGEATGQNTPEADKEVMARQVESRKLVKTFAKRAIRDYMTFISQFDYSPNLPVKIAKEFNDRVNLVAHGVRSTRSFDVSSSVDSHTVYPLSELFAAVPPSDLPSYPSNEIVSSGGPGLPLMQTESCEWATYHPLLTDALHSLLLCHCLAQTSTKELQRHAYMVARLIRLSDGYPAFQASRSPARADWVEVIRRAENWLRLSGTWDTICAPAPLPIYDDNPEQKPGIGPCHAASAAAILLNGGSAEDATEERRRERIREQAIIDALDDERVTDEASFRAAIKAHEKRAEQDQTLFAAKPADVPSTASRSNSTVPSNSGVDNNPPLRRWSAEDGREYPILTERAAAIARWVREAPLVTGIAKHKKRAKKVASSKVNSVNEGITKLNLGESTGA